MQRAHLVFLLLLLVACAAPRRRETTAPPPAPTYELPPPGDYAVSGLEEPLARLGGPIQGRPGSRAWSFTGTRGAWHLELGRYDEKGRPSELLTIDGKAAGARATLDWSLVVADAAGKPRERFTGKLHLRARDRRVVDGVFTFDEIPGRRDEVTLERLEDPLAGE